jgi:hypothetical protein
VRTHSGGFLRCTLSLGEVTAWFGMTWEEVGVNDCWGVWCVYWPRGATAIDIYFALLFRSWCCWT